MNPLRATKPTVDAAHLAAAIRSVAAMDVDQKMLVCDRICAEQPNLLASVLALPRLEFSMATLDVLVSSLIVLTLAVENSGQHLPTVSEAEQERELQRLVAMMRFSEGLDAAAMRQSFQLSTAYRRECFLLAYVFGALQQAGLTGIRGEAAKYPVLAAINLVNCIATAKRLRPRS